MKKMTGSDERQTSDASAARSRAIVQVVWGGVLVLTGVGVFYRIPAVMQKVMTIEQFASSPWIVRVCFYLLGFLLIASGAKKITDHIPTIKRPQH